MKCNLCVFFLTISSVSINFKTSCLLTIPKVVLLSVGLAHNSAVGRNSTSYVQVLKNLWSV